MSAARPSEPAALAASVTSSLVLVHDPVCRATAPDYWDWSADAHRTAVRTLTAIDDDRVRTAAGRLTGDPADDTAAAALTTALTALLSRPGGESDAVDALRAAAARTESLSRLLVRPGAPSPSGPAGKAPGAEELLTALARKPHGGDHPVDAAVVIPFRAPDDATGRVRNLAAVLNALADQSHPRDRYRVVVVESDSRSRWRDLFADACDAYVFAPDPGRFNKSWTVNVGVVHGARPAELVCVLDGDILVDRDFVARAVERFARPGTQAHWPFEDMLFLDPSASSRAVRARCLDGAAEPGQDRLRGVFLRRPPGAASGCGKTCSPGSAAWTSGSAAGAARTRTSSGAPNGTARWTGTAIRSSTCTTTAPPTGATTASPSTRRWSAPGSAAGPATPTSAAWTGTPGRPAEDEHRPHSGHHPPPDQRRGPTMDTRHTVIDSGLGPLTVVARGQALTGLYFTDHVRRPAEEALGPRVPAEDDPCSRRPPSSSTTTSPGGATPSPCRSRPRGTPSSTRSGTWSGRFPTAGPPRTERSRSASAPPGSPSASARPWGPTRCASSSRATGSSAPTTPSPATREASPANALCSPWRNPPR